MTRDFKYIESIQSDMTPFLSLFVFCVLIRMMNEDDLVWDSTGGLFEICRPRMEFEFLHDNTPNKRSPACWIIYRSPRLCLV